MAHPDSFDIDGDLLDLRFNDPQTQVFNELTLIGRIILDKVINFKATKSILNNVWDLHKSHQLSHLARNTFACTFETILEKEQVLAASPWSIKGSIVVLKQWSPTLALDEIDFSLCPFWVQMHHIPLNRINVDNATRFGNFIGTFITVNKGVGEHRIRGHLRFQVSIDTTQPSKTGVFIKNDDGSIRWLAFQYERLSDFCFCCGKLGHVVLHCSDKPTPNRGVEDPRLSFGAWLRTDNNLFYKGADISSSGTTDIQPPSVENKSPKPITSNKVNLDPTCVSLPSKCSTIPKIIRPILADTTNISRLSSTISISPPILISKSIVGPVVSQPHPHIAPEFYPLPCFPKPPDFQNESNPEQNPT